MEEEQAREEVTHVPREARGGSWEGTHERALKDGKGPYFVPWPSHASWTRPFLAISRRAQGKPREVGAIIKVTSRVEKVRLGEGT